MGNLDDDAGPVGLTHRHHATMTEAHASRKRRQKKTSLQPVRNRAVSRPNLKNGPKARIYCGTDNSPTGVYTGGTRFEFLATRGTAPERGRQGTQAAAHHSADAAANTNMPYPRLKGLGAPRMVDTRADT